MKFVSFKLFYAILIVSFLVFGISCKQNRATESIKTETIAFTKEGMLQIFKNDSLVQTLDVEFAETDYEVQTGLMYRQSMEDNQGMLFIFPDESIHSFYMKNTEFALDIIYVDANQKIASFQKNAQPFDQTSLSSKVPIQYVLEVNAGLSDRWNLIEGDSISFKRMN